MANSIYFENTAIEHHDLTICAVKWEYVTVNKINSAIMRNWKLFVSPVYSPSNQITINVSLMSAFRRSWPQNILHRSCKKTNYLAERINGKSVMAFMACYGHRPLDLCLVECQPARLMPPSCVDNQCIFKPLNFIQFLYLCSSWKSI